MKLYELLKTFDDGAEFRVTVDGKYIVSRYCWRGDYSDILEFIDYEVNSVRLATVTDYTKRPDEDREEVIPSVDVASDSFVEIWHTEDGDDWAQVNIDKASGLVTSIMTGDGDYCDAMTYGEAVQILTGGGFTDFDPCYDRYSSWYEYNDAVSAGGAHGYL